MSGPSFTLTTADVVSEARALGYFGEKLGCTERFHGPESLAGPEVRITAWTDPKSEDPDLAAYLKARNLLVVTFDPAKGLGEARYAEVVNDIITAAVGFLEEHPGARAVMHDDDSFNLLLWRGADDQIELDRYLQESDGLNYSGAFDELTSRYPVADLGELDAG